MPARSKAQFKLMAAISSGNLKKPGLSKEEAKEYISHNTGKQAFSRLKDKIRKK